MRAHARTAACAAALVALAGAAAAAAAAAPRQFTLWGDPLPDAAPPPPTLFFARRGHHQHARATGWTAAAGRPPPVSAPWWAAVAGAARGVERFAARSPANGRVTVRDSGRYRFLLFNDAAIQSVALLSDAGEPLADAPVPGYVRASIAAALALRPLLAHGSIFVAGAGGGTLPLALAAACPHARVGAVDIDPVVLDAGRLFGLPPRLAAAAPAAVAAALARAPRDGRVTVAAADAVAVLRATPPGTLDAVFVDVATATGGARASAAATAAVAAAAAAVARGGVVAVNAACPPGAAAAAAARTACVDAVAAALATGLRGAPYVLEPPPSPAEAGNVVVIGVAGAPASRAAAARARAAAPGTPAATVLQLDVGELLEGLAPWEQQGGKKELRKV